MKYPKIALRGDGTIESGTKIINKLISLGATNPNALIGHGAGYYFINNYGNINARGSLPAGYTLIQLTQSKLFKLI